MPQPTVLNGTSENENKDCTFTVGVSEDRNRKCRKTMEDAHTYIYNFGGKQDDGYFGVFDGHAGRQAADWSSKKLHIFVEDSLKNPEFETAAQALNHAFTTADVKMKAEGVNNSGCTAAVAVLRWEKSNTLASNKTADGVDEANLPVDLGRRRVLYAGNVGDTRVVLCRGGKALRLSYDHKGSDSHEAKRIANAGGLMVNNRVNGVLAVTRSLGDNFMKQLVVGAPYTTETVLDDNLDDFIIIACDGLWDVCTDEQAVDLIKDTQDPKAASQQLIDYALQHFSSDNLTCMVIRLH